MRRVYGQSRAELRKRVVVSMERVHRPSLVAWEKDVRNIVEKDLRETWLRRETRPCVRKPARAVAIKVVASGQMIVVQDRNPRGEIKMRLKHGGEGVP